MFVLNVLQPSFDDAHLLLSIGHNLICPDDLGELQGIGFSEYCRFVRKKRSLKQCFHTNSRLVTQSDFKKQLP